MSCVKLNWFRSAFKRTLFFCRIVNVSNRIILLRTVATS